MSSKRKGIILLVILWLIVATVLAIYFKTRVSHLTNELTAVQRALEKRESFEENETVKQLDSLIFLGDYTTAHQLSLELQNSPVFAAENSMQLRFKMTSDIVAKDNKNRQKNTELSVKKSRFSKGIFRNKQTSDSIGDTNKIAFSDSTKSLQQSLGKLSFSEKSDSYLTFKTTKGTALHYVGAAVDNKANGYGIAILKSGSRYEGYWKDNKRHGEGKFFWNDGEYYEGEYQNDKRSGNGTYYWANGDKYIGEWKDDKRNGKGKFYNKKGKLKASGIWKEDELVEKEK